MTKQISNALIVAAVFGAAALVLFALSFVGSEQSANPTANVPPPALPGQQAAAPPPPAPSQPQPPAPAGPSQPADVPGATKTASGLQFVDQVTGSGAQPQPGQMVTVHYTGMLEDGTIFDSSVQRGQPAEFAVDGVIPGFREGILGMKVGGKRKLIIPSALGYGPAGAAGGAIPPNATLVFEVELLGVK
jgi:peptidylprolyl isomerase